MDEHARDEHEDDVDVFPGNRENHVHAPCCTHLVHHVLCRVPGDFVRFGRVEVRAGAEEETRERDEDERKRDVPSGLKPFQLGFILFRFLFAEQVEYDGRVNAEEENAEPDGGNRAYGYCEMLIENRAQRKQSKSNRGADGGAALDPELVEHLAKAVQTAPDDEVPAGTMPPTADNLCRHGVHVRGNRLAGFRLEVGDNADVEEEHAECDADPHASRKENRDKAQESHPEERADGGISVTAKRDVQVIAPPAR